MKDLKTGSIVVDAVPAEHVSVGGVLPELRGEVVTTRDDDFLCRSSVSRRQPLLPRTRGREAVGDAASFSLSAGLGIAFSM